MSLVLAAHKPFNSSFSSNTGSSLFDYEVTPRVGTSVRAYDDGKAQVLQEFTGEEFKLIAGRAASSARNLFEVKNRHRCEI